VLISSLCSYYFVLVLTGICLVVLPVQSIGIAAAPKFGQQQGLGSLSLNTNKTKPGASSASRSPARSGKSPTASGGASRVSAVRMEGSDNEGAGAAAAGVWDEDKELDDLIGDD
jgi:hypothetical protein